MTNKFLLIILAITITSCKSTLTAPKENPTTEPTQAYKQQMENINEAVYFRATGNDKLAQIYKEINKLETTEIEELKYYDYDEKYREFELIAGLLVLVEVGLRKTVFRSFI